MITQQRVREFFDYIDGVLVYKNKGLRVKAGQPVGWNTGNGYLRTDVDGKKYYVHRLVWLYHNGPCEYHLIDHIDGNKKNNKIENLRLADKSSYGLNRNKARSDSKSKLIGVLSGKTKKGTKTYTARLTVKGERFHLGNYKTPEEAHEIYLQAKKCLLTTERLNNELFRNGASSHSLGRGKGNSAEQHPPSTGAKDSGGAG